MSVYFERLGVSGPVEKRVLQPEDIYQLRTVGEAEVSPDGRYLVYVVESIDEQQDCSRTDLYLLDLANRQTKRLTNSGKDSAPRWSADGRRLAFISDRTGQPQIWVLDLGGGEAWRVPTAEKVTGTLCWFANDSQIAYQASVCIQGEGFAPYPGAPADDGKRLVALATRAATEAKPADNQVKVITRLRYRGDGLGYYGWVRKHIFVTLVPERAPVAELQPAGRRITDGDFDFGAPTVSPDGRYLLTSVRQTADADYHQEADLWVYVVQTGEARMLYQGPGPIFQPLWSPDGATVAFLGHDLAHNVSTSADLWLLPVHDWMEGLADGQSQAALTRQNAQNVTAFMDRSAGAQVGPELRHGGSIAFWAGDRFYFVLSDQGAGGIYSTDASGSVQTILHDPGKSVTSIAGNGQVLVYAASQPDQPEELFLHGEDSDLPLTQVNAAFLSDIRLGSWERLAYPSTDGTMIDGWIIYPVDYQPGKRYPLLLLVHGGPHGAYGSAFMFAGQIFAGQGYAVLFTNPRGSTTYGQDFTRAIDKNWGVIDYADIMAGVDRVIAQGLADPKQLFVHGWSFGGYMTCWLVTQTNRFRAACGGASVTNLLSDYGTTDIMWADEWEYGGQPWRDAAHLLQHSPLSYVQQVETPLLLMHGEGDMRVQVSQSEEFYVALRRLGKTAVMVRYPGEYHGLRRPVHRVDRYRRLVAWFNHYRAH